MRITMEDRDKRLTRANEQIRNLNDEMSDDKSKIKTLQQQLADETNNNKKNCCLRFFGR